PPNPTVDVTIDPTGGKGKTGVIRVSGTYTCTGDFVDIRVDVRQEAGRFELAGFAFFTDASTCDGNPHPWSAEVRADNGRFAGGKASVHVQATSCDFSDCAQDVADQRVKLNGKQK